MAITYMTKEGYKKKMEEIAHLESVERPKISQAIAEARDKDDLSDSLDVASLLFISNKIL